MEEKGYSFGYYIHASCLAVVAKDPGNNKKALPRWCKLNNIVTLMLTTPNLRVIHLTTHVGLIKAIESITPERTYKVVKLAHETLSNAGMDNPRIRY